MVVKSSVKVEAVENESSIKSYNPDVTVAVNPAVVNTAKSSDSFEFLSLFFLPANRKSNVNTDIVIKGDSLTQQHFKESCDINNIIKNYTALGYSFEKMSQLVSQVFADASRFVDVSDVPDIMTAYNKMSEAQDSFIQNIPAIIRKKFNNDAMTFYKYVSDVNNKDEVVKMFKDVKNYAPLTSEQLQEVQHKPDISGSSEDSKK